MPCPAVASAGTKKAEASVTIMCPNKTAQYGQREGVGLGLGLGRAMRQWLLTGCAFLSHDWLREVLRALDV